jgi:glutamate racemase
MIGVIDAGLGGLTVVDALRKQLPDQDIVYYADTLRAPYGNRSPEAIVRGALEAAERVWRSGARILVTASHTFSAVAFEALSRRFGDALLDVATTAVQAAVETSPRQRIGLVASRATVASRRYEELIRCRCPRADIVAAACPLWGALVEEGWQQRREAAWVIKRGVREIKQRRVDTLILGSNAFIALQPMIQRKVGPQVVLVEASVRLVSRLAERLRVQVPPAVAERGPRTVRLLVSDLTPHLVQTARRFLGRNVSLEQAD